MPNVIKYTTGATPTGCLRKGNMLIGNNTADYGLTFYNGINPPNGGYTIYLNKASGGPSIYCPANNTQLIGITNQIAGANYTTAAQCFDYFASQTDKICVNFNYEGIVTDGLILTIDAGFTVSYPTTGTTWYDLSGNSYNGTLTNGPTFNSSYSGSIVFDGVDDYINYSFTNPYSETVIAWAKSGTTNWNQYGWISSCRSQNGHIIHPEINIKTLNFYVIDQGNTYTNIGNVTPSDVTIPHMYAYSTNGSNLHKCYFDGSLLNTNTTSITRTQSPTPQSWDIGRDNCCGGGRAGNGSVYSIIRYNRQLTDAEVLQNYNAQKGRFGL